MTYDKTSICRAVLAALLLAPPAFAAAQEIAEEVVIPAPKFSIERFDVIGDNILGAEMVGRLVAPFTGKDKDFGDVQRALETLELAYRERGYGVIQVQLPEQDITRGVVRFNIIQPRVGKVNVEGNQYFSNQNIRRSLPAVKEGETPNSNDIARNLQIAAEHPVKQTNVLLRSGENEGLVDVNVRMTDERPLRMIATLDDSGTSDTGYLRLGVGFQHTNLFDRDHSLSAQYVTSPTNLDQVSVYGLGYKIPYYRLYSTLEMFGGYSNVDSGTVSGLFNVSGKGSIFGMKWNYFPQKWNDIEQKVSFGLDYRAYQNSVTLAGIGLVPDITVHPVSLGYTGLLRKTVSETGFYASLSRNIPGGQDGTQADFEASRTGAKADYAILRYGVTYSHAFSSEWQARIAFNGQFTRDLLVAGEQYGIGGPDSVRGYLSREASSDYGYATQVEMYTPNLSDKLGMSDKWRSRLVGFYDFGNVYRNDPLQGEQAGKYLASTGVGLRLAYGKGVNLRLDMAQVIKAHGTRQTDNIRLSGSLALVY